MPRFATLLVALLLTLLACKGDGKKNDPTQGVPGATGTTARAPSPTTWTHPFLYAIGERSYLFGTIHIDDKRLTPYPKALADALNQVDVVATELPMEPEVQMAFSKFCVLSDNRTLESEVAADTYKRVRSQFIQKALPMTPFSHMKPWFVAMQIAMLDHLMELGKPIDGRIYRDAKDAHKEAIGLETVEEQVGIFDGLNKAEQEEMLVGALDARDKMRKEGRDALRELLDDYIAGDEDKFNATLAKELEGAKPLDLKLQKRLIDDRNETMTQRIEGFLKQPSGKRYLFAVGSAHVIGPNGIVAKLRQRGFKAERVAR